MYDEFERAVTGNNGEKLSFLAWMSIAIGTLFVLLIIGAGLAAVRVKHEVIDIAEVIQHELEARPVLAAEAMVEQLEAHASLLSVPPAEGVTLLQDLGSGSPDEAFMKKFFGETLNLFPEGHEFFHGLKEQAREASEDFKGGGGEVSLDLIRGEDGGSLVITTEEGEVRFDMKKTEDGGSLTIDSDDGQIRFDVIKGEDGGSLIVNSEDGQLRFDAKGGDDGGTMVISTDDATIRFAAGDEAEAMPAWVERFDGMPSNPEGVYSLSSEEGFMGAVAWEGQKSGREILSFYRDWLEGEGYEMEAQLRSRGAGQDVTSLWARNEDAGRVVFMVVGEEDGMTNILLGYGEGEG